jgi:hypothetical protein
VAVSGVRAGVSTMVAVDDTLNSSPAVATRGRWAQRFSSGPGWHRNVAGCCTIVYALLAGFWADAPVLAAATVLAALALYWAEVATSNLLIVSWLWRLALAPVTVATGLGDQVGGPLSLMLYVTSGILSADAVVQGAIAGHRHRHRQGALAVEPPLAGTVVVSATERPPVATTGAVGLWWQQIIPQRWSRRVLWSLAPFALVDLVIPAMAVVSLATLVAVVGWVLAHLAPGPVTAVLSWLSVMGTVALTLWSLYRNLAAVSSENGPALYAMGLFIGSLWLAGVHLQALSKATRARRGQEVTA